MQELKLNARLRAYSRAPYYTDWIRDITSQADIPEASINNPIAYARAYDSDGEPTWIKLDISLLNKETIDYLIDLVNVTEDEFKEIETEFNRIQDNIDFQLEVTGPYSNQLVFTNAKGQKKAITLPSSYPDKFTLNINEDHLLYVMDTPDEETITIVDTQVKPIYNALNEIVGNQKISGKLQAQKLFVQSSDSGPTYISGEEIYTQLNDLSKNLSTANKNIKDLENYVQGKGGFIDPYDFQRREVEAQVLSRYYYNTQNKGIVCDIPDQTKVKNLYDGCIWVYVSSEDKWVNEGADVVVMANNDGIVGVVTGSNEDYKISINADGIMSVNKLDDTLLNLQSNKVQIIPNTFENDAVYVQGTFNQKLLEISKSNKAETVVVRDETGTILTNTMGTNIYESINIDWLSKLFATSADIDSIKPILGDD